jgi:hypothetical protein
MQFVDTREVQEGMQQQMRRHLGRLYVLVHGNQVWSRPDDGGRVAREGGVLFRLVRCRMNGLRMLGIIKILWVVAAVAHKLLWPEGMAVLGEGLLLVADADAGQKCSRGGNALRTSEGRERNV